MGTLSGHSILDRRLEASEVTTRRSHDGTLSKSPLPTPDLAVLFLHKEFNPALSFCLKFSHGQCGLKKASRVLLPRQGVGEAQDGADQLEL